MQERKLYSSHPEIAHINWLSDTEVERALKLKSIKRWSAVEDMTHRVDVLTHSIRVTAGTYLIGDMLAHRGIPIDMPLAGTMADHHDDPEMASMEDVPAPIKRKATRAERRRMQKDELKAAAKIDNLVSKPTWLRDFPELVTQYRRQDTIEARIVHYVDKWDGLNEAINEVVCGENKDEFRGRVEEYREEFEELRKKNKDWLGVLPVFFGDRPFDFPEPDKLMPKGVEDLNWKNSYTLMDSVAQGNPLIYEFWLKASHFTFGLEFFEHTLPGWIQVIPEEVRKDIERVKAERSLGQMGIYSAHRRDPKNPTFGESLEVSAFELKINAIAILLRVADMTAIRRGQSIEQNKT